MMVAKGSSQVYRIHLHCGHYYCPCHNLAKATQMWLHYNLPLGQSLQPAIYSHMVTLTAERATGSL